MERELEVILDSTHDAMIAVDSKGFITLFNKAAKRLTKLEHMEVIGKHITEVVHNTRLPYVLQTGKSELNRKQPLRDISIITNRMPVKDDNRNIIGAVAVFRDITELKDLAEEITNLKEIQSMLQAIFHSTQDAISVVDENGIGMLINPAYSRLTGLTEKDIIGQICTVDIAEGDSIHLQVINTKKPIKNARLKVGPLKKQVIADAAPILVDGELRGSVAVLHDITEIKMLTSQLDQAKQIIRKLEAKYTFEDIIGEDEKLKGAMEKAEKAAVTPATVILRGESGTGKELFAHAIHNASNRKNRQFVRVNCAAISESILESELFGYEEGAFTGARKGGKKGLFEHANGGTIFLDEIGEINLNTQAKLLRVLQEKEFVRVGGNEAISVNVRVIAATNLDLEKAIKEGRFREDLYYRLNVIPIVIPPLRHRKKDIPSLVKQLIKKFNQEYGRSVQDISSSALDLLIGLEWKGNIRELENFVGRAMINMKFNELVIRTSHLPAIEGKIHSKSLKEDNLSEFDLSEKTLEQVLQESEKRYIKAVLNQLGGNRTKAADKMGVSIRSLYYKMKKYNLD